MKHGIRNGTGDANWGKDDVEKGNYGASSTGKKARALKLLKGAGSKKLLSKKKAIKKLNQESKVTSKKEARKAFAAANKKLK